MKRRIKIRVDANPSIGLGHLYRCIALAHMLSNEYEISFYPIISPSTAFSILTKEGFTYTELVNNNEFLKQIYSEDIVIVDGYHFDQMFLQEIKNINAVLVEIDDLHQRHFISDLIINHAPFVKPSDYSTENHTKYCLGLDFALLRPNFLLASKRPRTIQNIDSVMVNFGGADPKNLTERTLSVLSKFKSIKRILVVLGSAYLHKESLTQWKSKLPHLEIKAELSEEQMAKSFINSDLAIVPCSGVLLEAIASGCNIISGYYIENQHNIYRDFLLMNAFIDASDFSENHLKQALKLALIHKKTNRITLKPDIKKRFVEAFKQLP